MVSCDRHPFFGASRTAILTASWWEAPRQQKLKPCSWDAHRTTWADMPQGKTREASEPRQRPCTLTLSLQSRLSLLHSHQEVFRKVLPFGYYWKAIPDIHHFLRRKDGKPHVRCLLRTSARRSRSCSNFPSLEFSDISSPGLLYIYAFCLSRSEVSKHIPYTHSFNKHTKYLLAYNPLERTEIQK